MSSHYLDPELEPADAILGATATLTGREARHAATVSRVRVGEVISIGNGRGLLVSGMATAVSAELVSVEITAVRTEESPRPAIWLAQALAKGDRDEAAVQAACELGVDGVIPWSARRSIVKWEGSKILKGRERWSAVVREAAKQSKRAFLPEVGSVVTTSQLAVLATTTRMLVLSPDAPTKLTELTLDERDVVVVVGPEGGISADELNMLGAAGAEPVKLGRTILRTGTAGPAAIAVLSAMLGRW